METLGSHTHVLSLINWIFENRLLRTVLLTNITLLTLLQSFDFYRK